MSIKIIQKIYLLAAINFIILSGIAFAKWEGPIEVVRGKWGSATNEFGIEHGDTSDRIPWLTAILNDGKIVISDEVNEREVVYASNGKLIKAVTWYLYDKNGGKTVNPEYPIYKYWDVQGYTKDGNIWMLIKDYHLKSHSGEWLKKTSDYPAELGKIETTQSADVKNEVTITYPDKQYTLILSNGRHERYIRDKYDFVNGISGKVIEKFNAEGKLLGRLLIPKDKHTVVRPGGGGFEEERNLIEEYSRFVVIDINGNVFTWKRTPTHYSIVKWTWKQDMK